MGSAQAATAGNGSGSYYDTGCRLFVEQRVDVTAEAVNIGQCIGAVRTIMMTGPYLPERLRFCPPNGASTWQGAKVVLKYMDDHPGQIDQDLLR